MTRLVRYKDSFQVVRFGIWHYQFAGRVHLQNFGGEDLPADGATPSLPNVNVTSSFSDILVHFLVLARYVPNVAKRST